MHGKGTALHCLAAKFFEASDVRHPYSSLPVQVKRPAGNQTLVMPRIGTFQPTTRCVSLNTSVRCCFEYVMRCYVVPFDGIHTDGHAQNTYTNVSTSFAALGMSIKL